MAKEKKIQYAIYFGIILILISYTLNYIINSFSHANIYVKAGITLRYLLSAIIGGYLGIRASKHLETKRD